MMGGGLMSREAESGSVTECLRIEGVRKAYGKREALKGVDLVVGNGEFVALLGPNGAGKSTLFQLLTGLFNPDAGRIRVRGHELARNPARVLAEIGVVFQQATLDGDRSVLANLRFHASLHGIRGHEARARIDDALTRLGLTERAADPVRELSGGNRRKVELARALVHRPSVLLMDEATVGLDPASRRQLLAEVRRLCTAGTGVLWATHLVDEAEQADRVVVLHRGEVLADAAPDMLRARDPDRSLGNAFLAMTGGAVEAG